MVGRIALHRLAHLAPRSLTSNSTMAARTTGQSTTTSEAVRMASSSAATSSTSASAHRTSAKASALPPSPQTPREQERRSQREIVAMGLRARLKAEDAKSRVRVADLKALKKRRGDQKLIEVRRAEIEQLDPILGHSRLPHGYAYWQRSELCQLLLTKDEVWGVRLDRRGQLIDIENDAARERAQKYRDALQLAPSIETAPLSQAGGDSASVEQPVKILNTNDDASTRLGPKRVNFGLDNEEDRKLLFAHLPAVILEDQTRDLHASMDSLTPEMIQIESRKIQQGEEEERGHVDLLSRILDLRNASSKGIFKENVRRIVVHFGTPEDSTKEFDTGSVEVQTAVLTYRIRAALEPLIKGGRKNFQSKRNVTAMISKRARLLKYLRRKSPKRYDALLPRIGVVHDAVAGEYLSLSKVWNKP